MPLSTIFQLYRGESVLLVVETRVTGENHLSQVIEHIITMLYWVDFAMSGIQTHNVSGDKH